MLDLFGSGYVIEHCVSALAEEQEKRAFEVYVTDTLQMISKNTANYAGGSYVTGRYIDIVNPKPEDNRTGDEIVLDIIRRAELKVKEGTAE